MWSHRAGLRGTTAAAAATVGRPHASERERREREAGGGARWPGGQQPTAASPLGSRQMKRRRALCAFSPAPPLEREGRGGADGAPPPSVRLCPPTAASLPACAATSRLSPHHQRHMNSQLRSDARLLENARQNCEWPNATTRRSGRACSQRENSATRWRMWSRGSGRPRRLRLRGVCVVGVGGVCFVRGRGEWTS